MEGRIVEEYKLKCFFDAYKGYRQIQMAKAEEEKTSFHTSKGTFCYTKMPFGLKKVGATYQWLIDRTFYSQIGRNIEIYVDDIIIKSKTEEEFLGDIQETFNTLRAINMKLNPKKCSFRVEEGKFLGYYVTNQGIKVNSSKVKKIPLLSPPTTVKEIQILNGKLAALGRFFVKRCRQTVVVLQGAKEIHCQKDL